MVPAVPLQPKTFMEGAERVPYLGAFLSDVRESRSVLPIPWAYQEGEIPLVISPNISLFLLAEELNSRHTVQLYALPA